MRVTVEDNDGRVVRERALRKICELLMESNTRTDIITKIWKYINFTNCHQQQHNMGQRTFLYHVSDTVFIVAWKVQS
jgi:hypothetical protein